MLIASRGVARVTLCLFAGATKGKGSKILASSHRRRYERPLSFPAIHRSVSSPRLRRARYSHFSLVHEEPVAYIVRISPSHARSLLLPPPPPSVPRKFPKIRISGGIVLFLPFFFQIARPGAFVRTFDPVRAYYSVTSAGFCAYTKRMLL